MANGSVIKPSCFKCFNVDIIIPTTRVCDGVVDCPDLTDECLCQGGVSVALCDHITAPNYENNML